MGNLKEPFYSAADTTAKITVQTANTRSPKGWTGEDERPPINVTTKKKTVEERTKVQREKPHALCFLFFAHQFLLDGHSTRTVFCRTPTMWCDAQSGKDARVRREHTGCNTGESRGRSWVRIRLSSFVAVFLPDTGMGGSFAAVAAVAQHGQHGRVEGDDEMTQRWDTVQCV